MAWSTICMRQKRLSCATATSEMEYGMAPVKICECLYSSCGNIKRRRGFHFRKYIPACSLPFSTNYYITEDEAIIQCIPFSPGVKVCDLEVTFVLVDFYLIVMKDRT